MSGLLAIGLSALLLFLAFRKVELETSLGLLGQVELSYVAWCVVTLLLVQIIKTYRWGILVGPFASLDTLTLFRVANLGAALVLLLPFRLGEFARPYLLKNEANVPMSAGLGAAVVERTVDGMAVVVIYFLASWSLAAHYPMNPILEYSAVAAAIVFGAVFAGITLALVFRDKVLTLIERITTPISPGLAKVAKRLVNDFVAGFTSLPNLRTLIYLLLLTIAYFAMSGLGLYFVMLAFGWDLPILSAFLLLCVIILGIMIPAGPGFLGTYQAALMLGLSIFGKGPTEAATYGLIIYPLTLLVVVGCGLPFLMGARRPSLRGMFEPVDAS